MGNRWIGRREGRALPAHNPATGELIARVASLDAVVADEAISAALAAFGTWHKTTAKHRADLLMNWHRLKMDNPNDFSLILTYEQGKPLREVHPLVLRWFAA